jgi:hypothetical protein
MLSPQPQNINFLQPTRFTMTFPRLSNTQYFCQSVNIPNITLASAIQPTPLIDINKPGNKITYGTLEINFIVDEELKSWKELYDWIKGLGYPQNLSQYSNLKNLSDISQIAAKPQYSDAIITTLSALNNPKLQAYFTDVFPVSLSAVNLRTTDTDTEVYTATAQFKFAYYDISVAT